MPGHTATRVDYGATIASLISDTAGKISYSSADSVESIAKTGDRPSQLDVVSVPERNSSQSSIQLQHTVSRIANPHTFATDTRTNNGITSIIRQQVCALIPVSQPGLQTTKHHTYHMPALSTFSTHSLNAHTVERVEADFDGSRAIDASLLSDTAGQIFYSRVDLVIYNAKSGDKFSQLHADSVSGRSYTQSSMLLKHPVPCITAQHTFATETRPNNGITPIIRQQVCASIPVLQPALKTNKHPTDHIPVMFTISTHSLNAYTAAQVEADSPCNIETFGDFPDAAVNYSGSVSNKIQRIHNPIEAMVFFRHLHNLSACSSEVKNLNSKDHSKVVSPTTFSTTDTRPNNGITPIIRQRVCASFTVSSPDLNSHIRDINHEPVVNTFSTQPWNAQIAARVEYDSSGEPVKLCDSFDVAVTIFCVVSTMFQRQTTHVDAEISSRPTHNLSAHKHDMDLLHQTQVGLQAISPSVSKDTFPEPLAFQTRANNSKIVVSQEVCDRSNLNQFTVVANSIVNDYFYNVADRATGATNILPGVHVSPANIQKHSLQGMKNRIISTKDHMLRAGSSSQGERVTVSGALQINAIVVSVPVTDSTTQADGLTPKVAARMESQHTVARNTITKTPNGVPLYRSVKRKASDSYVHMLKNQAISSISVEADTNTQLSDNFEQVVIEANQLPLHK